MHFVQVSLCWCCPHVQKQACSSGSSWEATEEDPLELCMLIGSSSSLRLWSGIPGLPGRTAHVVPLGLLECGDVGRLQPCLAASKASPGSTVAIAGCRGARSIYLTSSPYSPAFASPCFSPSAPCFSLLQYLLLSCSSLPLFLSHLLSPPHSPSLLFSLLSITNPRTISPAGSSSPGSCWRCVTDALHQQGAAAEAQAPAPTSCLPTPHQESLSLAHPGAGRAQVCRSSLPQCEHSLPPEAGSSPQRRCGDSAERRLCVSAACHPTHDHLALGSNHKLLSGFGPLL